ncbi:MAG: alpha/beta hydrolase [Pseudomonadota bacterium]
MRTAPLYTAMAMAPQGGAAYWLTAPDETRLRLGIWNEGTKGTVFLFPGRTEYIEKYGPAAREFAAHGYSTFSIDWRGQGLADRLCSDPALGHIGTFSDYQLDVQTMIQTAKRLELPKPWYLMAHSMGGCIGLRALLNGLPVNAAVFSAPMWGIQISKIVRPFAWAIGWGSRMIGHAESFVPGTSGANYVLSRPFEGNALTTDRGMFDFMRAHLIQRPELGLGGPSLNWMFEALRECADLARRPAPAVQTIVFLGTRERIVDPVAIGERVAHWPGGTLCRIEGAEHEVMMETEAIRRRVFDVTITHFAAHR